MKILNRIKSKLSKNYIDHDTIKYIIDIVNEIYQEQEIRLFLADCKNLSSDDISQYHVGGDTNRYVDYVIEYTYPSTKECASFCGENNMNISILCGKRNVYYKKINYRSYDFDKMHTNIESYMTEYKTEISDAKTMCSHASILVIPKWIYTTCVECGGTKEFIKDMLRRYLLSEEIEYVDDKLKKYKSEYRKLEQIKQLSNNIRGNSYDEPKEQKETTRNE